MKKYITFIIIVLLIIIVFLLSNNKAREYELDYKLKDFNVSEKYIKSLNAYSVNVTKDDVSYYFVFNHDYSKNRKIVTNIKEFNNNDLNCLSITSFKENYSQCYKDGEYYSSNYSNEIKESKLLDTKNNVLIYDNNNDYYIWNNKGLYDVLKDNTINFLSNEAYNNSLYFKSRDYILFADYDSKKSFNKFYVFINKTKTVETWELDRSISLDSYFLGEYKDWIYLFDKENKVEYKLNYSKKKIKVVSNKNGGITYDNGFIDLTLEKMTYNTYEFNFNKVYYYFIDNNKLYLKLYDSEYNILICDLDVKYIVSFENDTVYFLSGTKLYSYNLNDGLKLCLDYFEWNFTYKDKIFIF